LFLHYNSAPRTDCGRVLRFSIATAYDVFHAGRLEKRTLPGLGLAEFHACAGHRSMESSAHGECCSLVLGLTLSSYGSRQGVVYPNRRKHLKCSRRFTLGSEKMSRFFFAVLMASSLFLTAYFGVAAWRLSDEGHLDVTGQIRPVAK